MERETKGAAHKAAPEASEAPHERVEQRSGVPIEGVPEGVREISAGGLRLPVENGVVWAPEALAADVRAHVQSFVDAAKREVRKAEEAVELADLKTNLLARIERIEKHLGIKL